MSNPNPKTLEPLAKIPLSVQLLVNSYNAGLKNPDIARMCHCSHQAVWDYYIRHKADVDMCLEKTDSALALQFKLNAAKASRKIELVLEEDMNKKDMIPLMAVADRSTINYRLLSDKSTFNISVQSVVADLEAALKALEALEVGDNPEKQGVIEAEKVNTLPPAEDEK